jgi:hypothetical protein
MYSLAREQNDSALIIGACRALATTLYFLGDFESGRQYAMRGVQIWRSGNVQTHPEDYITPVVDWGHVRVAFRRDRLLPRDSQ